MKVLNILVRRCLSLEDLEQAVSFYESLTGQPVRLRFDYPEFELKLVQVASILFIAGTAKSLSPFISTHMTFLVDDIRAFEVHLPTMGATVLEISKAVPTGWNMLARHPDGAVVEYVQHHDPHPDDWMPKSLGNI